MDKHKKTWTIRNRVHGKQLKRILLLEIVGYLMVLTLIVYYGIFSYQHYKQETIENEEKQLLTMAQTVGGSLVQYMELELDSIDLYFSSIESNGFEGFDVIEGLNGQQINESFIKSTAINY